jgi:phosphoglycerate dehydrogenase-like enzyme
MSEFVLGWILSIERQIMQRAKAMTWDPRPETGVRGKVMGILGTGSIGSAIAAAAEPLGHPVPGHELNRGIKTGL